MSRKNDSLIMHKLNNKLYITIALDTIDNQREVKLM